MTSTTIAIKASRYEDHDDSLAACAADEAIKRGLESWDLAPTWSRERAHILIDVPLTKEMIEELSEEAAGACDAEMVAICDRALDGDDEARAECARVISEAAAQVD